jgi:hypothetical protein
MSTPPIDFYCPECLMRARIKGGKVTVPHASACSKAPKNPALVAQKESAS